MNDSREVYKYKNKILEKYPNLIERINKEDFFPIKVEIHLPPKTEKLCWLNCKHCYTQCDIEEKFPEDMRISKERILELIEEISNGNPKNGEVPYQLIFSGFRTDPLNSLFIDDVLKFSIEKNFSFGVHTKGLILKDTTIDFLTSGKTDEDYVSFSVDAGDNETYNVVHGIENSNAKLFSRVVENIRRLTKLKNEKKANLKIRVTYLLTKENSHDSVNKFIEAFSDIDVDTIRFSVPIYPKMGSQERKTIHEEIPEERLNELKKMFSKLSVDNEKIIYLDFSSNQERILPCYVRYLFPTIGYDGHLYPCCLTSSKEFEILRISDLKNEGFWEGYNTQKKLHYCLANCQCDRNSSELNKEIFKLSTMMQLQ